MDTIRKGLLLLAGVICLALSAALGQTVKDPVASHGADATPEVLAFAVATIKPSKSINDLEVLRPLPDGIRATSITVLALIRSAFGSIDVPGAPEVSGVPDWVASARFDVAAKADERQLENLLGLSSDERDRKFNLMLQALLIDRFKLGIHKESKDVPAYKLVLAKASRKPNEATSRDPEFPTGTLRVTRGQIAAQAISMDRIASLLSLELQRPVLNETGLSGRYDLAITWQPAETPGSVFSEGFSMGQTLPVQPNDDGVSVASGILKDLGLKLEASKTPREVLVIDHIEKPSEN